MERQTANEILDEIKLELYDYIDPTPADIQALDMAKISLDVWDRMMEELDDMKKEAAADDEALEIALGLDIALSIVRKYLWEVEEGDLDKRVEKWKD